MMMRLGIAQWCLDVFGVAVVDRAAQLGLQLLHLDAGVPGEAPSLADDRIRECYLSRSRRNGISITAVVANLLCDHGMIHSVDSTSGRICRRTIQIAIDAAQDMGVPLVVLPSFMDGEIRSHEDFQHTIEALQFACEISEKNGVKIASENTLSIRQNLKLIEEVKSSHLQILFDVLNPVLWGHNPVHMIESLGDYFSTQIHVKDGTSQETPNVGLGRGRAQLLSTFQALRKRGLARDIILENEYQHMQGQVAVLLRHDVDVLYRLWTTSC